MCTIIDAFHFPLPASAATDTPEHAASDHAAAALDEVSAREEGAEDDADEAALAAAEAKGAEEAADIQRALVQRVLPALRAQLVRQNPAVPLPQESSGMFLGSSDDTAAMRVECKLAWEQRIRAA